MKSVLILMTMFVLSGCATLNASKEIPANQSADFYRLPKDGVASIFYVCGKSKVESWLFKTVENDLALCKLQINNDQYTIVKSKSVGRIDLTPGTYEFKNQDEMLAKSIPTKIEVRPSDVILLTSEFVQSVAVTGSSYVFTINWTKDNPLEIAKNYKPVEMQMLTK